MNDEQYSAKRRHLKLPIQRGPTTSEGRTRLAQRALRNAAAERVLARNGGANAAKHLAEAERIESVAADLMTPTEAPVVTSGEVVHASGEYAPPREFVDTLTNSDQAAIEASVARADLLVSAKADIVAMAVDAAASAKADNSFEKMLSHQLALIHVLTMKTGSRALDFEKRQGEHDDGLKQADSVELARLAQATSRLSSAFQDGLLTLQRLRNGSSQTVTVRHVTVEAGGQAVIGNIKGGDGPNGNSGRGKRK